MIEPCDLEIGRALPPLVSAPITRMGLALFAGASGDHNPVHIDIDYARAAGLDDVFAHGMLGMAILGRLLSDNIAPAAILRFSVRFTSLIPLGSRLHCRGTVVDRSCGAAQLELIASLDDGTVVLTGAAKVQVEQEAR
jgi:acyl dehydratase